MKIKAYFYHIWDKTYLEYLRRTNPEIRDNVKTMLEHLHVNNLYRWDFKYFHELVGRPYGTLYYEFKPLSIKYGIDVESISKVKLIGLDYYIFTKYETALLVRAICVLYKFHKLESIKEKTIRDEKEVEKIFAGEYIDMYGNVR